jgi:ATPase subunit of ABC transporter with duplicated ATPase domains
MNAFEQFLIPQSAGRNVAVHGEVKPKAVINVTNLCFSWNSAKEPLLDINTLQIEKGERVFIEGPNCIGKSTLLGLLAGVSIPHYGALGRHADLQRKYTQGHQHRSRLRKEPQVHHERRKDLQEYAVKKITNNNKEEEG